MSGGRLRWWLLTLTVLLAVIGVFFFIGGVGYEFVATRSTPLAEPLSPALTIAVTGMCLAAMMVLIWFAIVGWSLARQTRAQGSGYGDAYRLIESFRFRDAIPLLERSISEGKETAEVLMLLTSAYAYAGQLAKAQATADRAVQLFPDDPDAYITLANGYRLQAAYDEAVYALRQAATLAPDRSVIWAELGFMQHFAGDESGALESFERATSQALPATYAVRAFYHLMRAYEQQGDSLKAARAAAKMMSARNGLSAWRSGLRALQGTAYGQRLHYEMEAIERAIADADASNLG
ncbi:MAG: tetratricopeptide repeat protein [Anaerolineae bacterium]|nr:tetratricopeptide repeat protein [Anaerolineae bacterium]